MKRFRYQVVGVFALALVLRLAAAAWWNGRHGDDFPLGDSDSYWRLAEQLADGEPYQYGGPNAKVFRAPGYPFILAAWFRVAGRSPRAARYLGAVFGALAVPLLMTLALVWSRSAPGALLAGLLLAVYPGAISTSVLLLSESPFVPFMVGSLLAWQVARQSPRPGKWAIVAGLISAAAALIRPSWLLFTPLACSYFAVAALVAWRGRAGPRTFLQMIWGQSGNWADFRIAVTVLLAVAVGMVPWWWRNYRAVGVFVPTTLQVGASLYDAWNPRADGGSDMWFVDQTRREAVRLRDTAGLPKGQPLEVYLDRTYKRKALRWIRENPRPAAKLLLRRLEILWNPWPRGNVENGSRWARHGIAVGYLLVIAAILRGVFRWRDWENPAELLWLPAAYFTLIHMVFVSSVRYRQPALVVAVAIAAAGLTARKTARNTARNTARRERKTAAST